MDILTQRKQDFHHILSILEFETESNVHKLFVELIEEGRRSFITFLNLSRSELQNLKTTDYNGNIIKLEDSEIINLSFCVTHLKANKIFSLNNLDRDGFESFKAKRGIVTSRPPISFSLPTEIIKPRSPQNLHRE